MQMIGKKKTKRAKKYELGDQSTEVLKVEGP